MSLLRLAWRNVLRQRRRTALLSLVVVYVTVAVLFLFGFLDGYGESLVEAYAEYVEAPVVVAREVWWQDPDPENGFRELPAVAHPLVRAATPSFAPPTGCREGWSWGWTRRGKRPSPACPLR